jgi:hypothetical protein
MGRLLIIVGLVLVVLGVLVIVLGRFSLPRLPGDILIERENYKIYIPISTAILLSIVLTLLAYLAGRFLR